MLKTYEAQLREAADKNGVDLREAFRHSGVGLNTMQRMIGGADIKAASAKSVMDAIAGLAALKRAAE